jgi:hypothetical protein
MLAMFPHSMDEPCAVAARQPAKRRKFTPLQVGKKAQVGEKVREF